MLQKKKGMPKEGDCLFCTVTKIQFHSVFVSLDEYENKSGMIHISEISPGRIRNINEFVKEGKVVVCKVLRIDSEKGHIDLSLRRVTESQRRAKVEERKQEAIAESIIVSYAGIHKIDKLKFYNELSNILLKSYDSIYDAFEDVVEEDASLVEMGVEETQAKELEKLIKERIKIKEVSIEGIATIHSYEPDGVDLICSVMDKAIKISNQLSIKSLGAGKYSITINALDYKEAETILNECVNLLESSFKKTNTEFKFERK
ncbi:MAG: translation initiation factor IF-2 subunit alpha [Candidatus Woesearchaeota archaeon]